MLDIVIATANRHKFRELSALLRVRGIRWKSLQDVPPTGPIHETGRTFHANAVLKARAVARVTGRLALADDSGLEVDALGGKPGVQSARFAGRHGDDHANNDKLLRMLRQVPDSRRGARYQCVLALCSPSGVIAVTHGTWRGRIAHEPHGRGGFGYDPLFWLPGLKKTSAQLSARAKNRVSHRGIAVKRMRLVLKRLAGATGRLPRAARSRPARPGSATARG